MSSEKTLLQTAREYALRRIHRKECSSHDIYRSLIKKGFSEIIADHVIQELVSENQINDTRYTSLLVRQQLRQGKGPFSIRQKLQRQGINLPAHEVRELVLENSEQSELEMATQWIQRRYPRAQDDQKEKAKAIQSLVRRGFSFSLAYQAVLGRENPED
jgi:regulatory protein